MATPNEYVVGAVVTLKDLISTDPAGLIPIDDATEVITVYKPDGATATPTVAHGSTGTYTTQITVDQVGWWEYVGKSTGAAAGARPGRFWVAPVP